VPHEVLQSVPAQRLRVHGGKALRKP
jgi:hypothetical protein